MKLRSLILASVCALGLPEAVQASITLDFDALDGSINESPLTYYAGGSGDAGTTGGPNYGITFSSNTITGCTEPNACVNVNSAGSPSNPNIIFFLSGGASTMNVATGFDTGFSFYYSAVDVPGVVNVWSGLDGTGSLLASLQLPLTGDGAGLPDCFGTNFCPYLPMGVAFSGTAMSVDFAGTADEIGFDNITLGSDRPTGAVPEPGTWALMLVGFGFVGSAMRRRSNIRTKVSYT